MATQSNIDNKLEVCYEKLSGFKEDVRTMENIISLLVEEKQTICTHSYEFRKDGGYDPHKEWVCRNCKYTVFTRPDVCKIAGTDPRA